MAEANTIFSPAPAADYEPRRLTALRDIAAHKAARRMQLAPDISFLWESTRTVHHQVQEMARMEGDDAEAMAAIFDEYAELLPRPGRLTATAFVEVVEDGQIKARLRHYRNLEHAFVLHTADGPVVPRILGDHGTDASTTAVVYLAFDVVAGTDLRGATLEVAHPELETVSPLPDAVVTAPW